MKPKFKMTKAEMVRFNKDCKEACLQCPQSMGRWAPDIEEIYEGNIKAKELVKHWLNCETLWDSGYSYYLTDFAKEVLHNYKLYKAKKLLHKEVTNEKEI